MQVVDTTGAGDCFTGAVAVALLEGKSEQEALRFAGEARWQRLCHSKLSGSAKKVVKSRA